MLQDDLRPAGRQQGQVTHNQLQLDHFSSLHSFPVKVGIMGMIGIIVDINLWYKFISKWGIFFIFIICIHLNIID